MVEEEYIIISDSDGNYFQGKMVTFPYIDHLICNSRDEKFTVNLLEGEAFGVYVWENTDTKKTIIAGSEGIGWYVILAEGKTREEAIKIYEAKKAAKKIFSEAWEKSKQPISEAELRSRLRREIERLFEETQGKVQDKPGMDKKKFVEICREVIENY